MTEKQKLILFLISCDPGIREIYTMVKVFDRADFPSEMGKNLKPLLNNQFICVSNHFNNGTPSAYEVTEQGKKYLQQTFDEKAIIEYIGTMENPELLLKVTRFYIDKRNGLQP